MSARTGASAPLQGRRAFIGSAAMAGLAAASGGRAVADDMLPETATVRFANAPAVCIAPQYIAEQLLRAEGFTDFHYVKTQAGIVATESLAREEFDFSLDFGISFIMPIDQGADIKVLSGVHVGCYELFAREGVRSVRDLAGKRVGAGWNIGSDPHVFVSAMVSHVGLDPVRDIDWVTSETRPLELFMAGEIDAFLSFPPEAQFLRREGVGHVIVDSMVDKPWSQYFCCMLASSTAYARDYPNATRRVLRAVLKGADVCAAEPALVARVLVESGYAADYDLSLQALREIPYAPWREYDHEDTIRFFALRLHEAGLINSSPQTIIANGTDWRFLEAVKQELKA
jgi:NitT/TauT family transport system substrate-binding protein